MHPINIPSYIDESARTILDEFALANPENNPFTGLTFEQTMIDFGEHFDDRIESYAAGHPFDIPATGDDTHDELNRVNFMNLMHDLLTARIFQLLFAYELTEDDLDPDEG